MENNIYDSVWRRIKRGMSLKEAIADVENRYFNTKFTDNMKAHIKVEIESRQRNENSQTND